MTEQATPTISIITATYNAAAVLPRLIESLIAQTDQNFEWVVADGASSDETLALLEQAKTKLKCAVIDSRPDFGIYDALNRGIKLSNGHYYLVLGADDELFPNAVAKYKISIAQSGADLISAPVMANGRLRGIRQRRWEWLYGQFAYVTAHAVGLATRKSLHDKLGFYSRSLPIAADQLFILKAAQSGVTIKEADFVSGIYNTTGTSAVDVAGCLTEQYRAQLLAGHNVYVQTIIFFLRILKHLRKLHP